MNDCPTVPVAETNVPLNTGAELLATELLMAIPNVPLAERLAVLVAVSVTELVPVAEGVPVMAPVAPLMLKPVGKPVAAYDND